MPRPTYQPQAVLDAQPARSVRTALEPRAFAAPDPILLRQYPCAYDATTSVGLGPLRRALPEWATALQFGRATLPPPTPSTLLGALLPWGTARSWPGAAPGVRTATKRRRALSHLRGLADDLPLASIDLDAVVRLDAEHRGRSPRRGGALVSSDLTELRLLLAEAREAAGLAPLDLPLRWPAARPHGKPRAREMATLDGVLAAMRGALTLQKPRARGGPPLKTRWLAGYLALQLAVPALPTQILGLRRADLVGDRVVIPADGPGSPALLFGFPGWAQDMLGASLPGWRDLRPGALLFPGRGGRPRTDVHRVLRIVAEAGSLAGEAAPNGLTPSAVRRQSQSVHRGMGAPRAVVRASARPEATATVDDEVSAARELSASDVVRRWSRMLTPPDGEPAPLPIRAPARCLPSHPELDPLRAVEPVGILPESCSQRTTVPTVPGLEALNRTFRTSRPAMNPPGESR